MRTHRDSTFPPELEFNVIDNLLDDKPTLASCSLVCSRWLPASRAHLFHTIVVSISSTQAERMQQFLKALEDSETSKHEWAIGTYIHKITLDGNPGDDVSHPVFPTVTCTLSFLCPLLSRLPQLTSMSLKWVLISDDLPRFSTTQQSGSARFKLDELVVYRCSSPARDSRDLLELVCKFSCIDSLTVDCWWWMPATQQATTPPAFEPPIVRSLAVEAVDVLVARALYGLFVDSPSVKNGHLTRLSVMASDYEELRVFSDFVHDAGPVFHHLKLHVAADVLDELSTWNPISLVPCTALRSLVLYLDCDFPWPVVQAHYLRVMFQAYAQLLREGRDAFPVLADIRFEMDPSYVSAMKDLILCVPGRDGTATGNGEAEQPAEEDPYAAQCAELWTSLDDLLCGFHALERVEFTFAGGENGPDPVTEETKDELRNGLAMRLPSLWRSGVPRFLFQDD